MMLDTKSEQKWPLVVRVKKRAIKGHFYFREFWDLESFLILAVSGRDLFLWRFSEKGKKMIDGRGEMWYNNVKGFCFLSIFHWGELQMNKENHKKKRAKKWILQIMILQHIV